MTAINAFYLEDPRYVYLACDGAKYSYDDGAVTELGGKVISLPKHGIVAALAGPNLGNEIAEAVRVANPLDQREALELFRLAFLTARLAISNANSLGDATGTNEMVLIAAVYLKDEARPSILSISTHEGANGNELVPQWREIEGVLIPSKVPDYITDRGAYLLDAVTDCRALFRAQRHHDFEGMHGAPAVGGTCQLYRIGADGISGWDILEFNDRVGAVADIADTGQDVLRTVYS